MVPSRVSMYALLTASAGVIASTGDATATCLDAPPDRGAMSWPYGTDHGVRINLDSFEAVGIANADVAAHVAMTRWLDESPTAIRLFLNGSSSHTVATVPACGESLIVFNQRCDTPDTNKAVMRPRCPVGGSFTRFSLEFFGCDHVPGDGVYDPDFEWSTGLPEPGLNDLTGVMIHELGHALDLDHTTGTTPPSVMTVGDASAERTWQLHHIFEADMEALSAQYAPRHYDNYSWTPGGPEVTELAGWETGGRPTGAFGATGTAQVVAAWTANSLTPLVTFDRADPSGTVSTWPYLLSAGPDGAVRPPQGHETGQTWVLVWPSRTVGFICTDNRRIVVARSTTGFSTTPARYQLGVAGITPRTAFNPSLAWNPVDGKLVLAWVHWAPECTSAHVRTGDVAQCAVWQDGGGTPQYLSDGRVILAWSATGVEGSWWMFPTTLSSQSAPMLNCRGGISDFACALVFAQPGTGRVYAAGVDFSAAPFGLPTIGPTSIWPLDLRAAQSGGLAYDEASQRFVFSARTLQKAYTIYNHQLMSDKFTLSSSGQVTWQYQWTGVNASAFHGSDVIAEPGSGGVRYFYNR